MKRLRIAAQRTLKVGKNGKPVLVKYKAGEELDWMTVAANKVMELAAEGDLNAIEHIANRFDGKVKEEVDITHNNREKVHYKTFEEAKQALLAEGINIDGLPLLTDMRPREKQEQN